MERRLTAILAADVVGYSRLMGANESGTLAALDALRTDFVNPKISEHQGRIVKLTGDGILVEFPSVVNAVACAVELQRGIRKQNAGAPQDQRPCEIRCVDLAVHRRFVSGCHAAARRRTPPRSRHWETPPRFRRRSV